ncbi:hypothetical protein DU67_06285 [Methanosarcina mazei]|uniref:Uncharacterized protein n=1 Tax=Methanosarcina mazei TaxID=2209 RepID=A0A0F8HJT1_METMZ|nr:hypothetical protein DU67_06285 [Methanosarcina mazei]
MIAGLLAVPRSSELGRSSQAAPRGLDRGRAPIARVNRVLARIETDSKHKHGSTLSGFLPDGFGYFYRWHRVMLTGILKGSLFSISADFSKPVLNLLPFFAQ